ncbi:hypothetical protein J3458_009377 [Metarhizium acridum]|uniref:uncharacterized protein n=1 Tax=Metarhizium acridum TaxID=92637 RepID=UPI001C6C87CD|nr:hypothetical protein J3458_009377 [Metarhizium acridum]
MKDEVKKLLPESDNLSSAIIELLDDSEVFYNGLRASQDIVVKITREVDNTTEYTSMQYLQDRMPGVPAPRPHGLVNLSEFYLTFMRFVPGLSLEKAWLNWRTIKSEM